MKTEKTDNKLFAKAESQQGYFTTRQAKNCGFTPQTINYHVKTGRWSRVYRGIYRLTNFPQTERPDLVIWALWSCNRKGCIEGVYSHQTALSIYGLSDVMPTKLHMTLPPSFRRHSEIPSVLIIYKKNLKKESVNLSDGYKVTTPYQTLFDIIESPSISHDLVIQAVNDSTRMGLITQKQLKMLLEEPNVLNSPLYTYLKGIQ
ncbi:hypothetical protein COB11_03500 [Candidatus Aerophobetes bacterium]|uniref:AbiEi antitoxin N-terminal domain-containing protein n=1 Tax=Aerophobetes bacterium TaxID=2030807 RepID=A0A2A4YJ41_UNCAE|nr:MAG: hypothetical protein COB11_03500 [Candidatus Aerophobetes bacterium]